MFEQAMLAAPRGHARGASFVVSIGAQMLVLGTLLLIPLIFIEGPSVARLTAMLTAPPPPPPPPPAIKLVAVPARMIPKFFDGIRFFAPRTIPKEVALINDPPSLPEAGAFTGVVGSIPGGVPEGVIGSIVNQMGHEIAPPKEPAKPVVHEKPVEKVPTQIRVSQGVQDAKLIKRIMPVYPQLAKAARISGVVKLVGIIGRDGHINSLQVLSGHPILVPAAVEAVKQWVYQPTLLSGEPVEVIAPIDVNFTLTQ